MRRSLIGIGLGLLLGGCGAAPAAQHLRFADVGKGGGRGIDWSRPIVLEFQPGDRLPIRIEFSDQIFDLAPAAPEIALVAKRHAFVRMDPGRRITSSLTGEDFEAKPVAPGTFRFGLALTPSGSWVDVGVRTPRHAEPK